jgi:hypothetical protein
MGGASLPLPVAAHPPAIVNQAAEKAIGEEVQAFRKAMADAIKAKDAAKLKLMFHPGFSSTRPDGRTKTRDACIEAALAGEPMIELAETRDMLIRVPNDWVAIATGTSEGKPGSHAPMHSVRWIAIYTRTDRSWALVASQVMHLGGAKP